MRLNEVAYGCGCDYRNIAGDGSGRIVDDQPTIAHILQEGAPRCHRKLPPEQFLAAVGATGRSYLDLRVASIPPHMRRSLPPGALRDEGDPNALNYELPQDLCGTVRGVDFAMVQYFASSPRRASQSSVASRMPAAHSTPVPGSRASVQHRMSISLVLAKVKFHCASQVRAQDKSQFTQ